MHRTNGFISVQYKYYLDNVREREREGETASQTDSTTDIHLPSNTSCLNTSCGSTSSTFSIFFLESFSACRERLQVIMEGQNQTHYILSERLLSDTSSRHFNVLQWGFLHTNYYDPLLWQLIFWSIFLKEYTGNHIPELCKSINRLLASNRSL